MAAAFAQDPTGEKRLLIPVRVRPVELTGLLKPIVYIDLVDITEKNEARQLLLNSVTGKRKKPLVEPDFRKDNER